MRSTRPILSLCLLLLVVLMIGPMSRAQIVVGEWAERMERDIMTLRTTPVRIIVLLPGDAPAVGVQVRVEQLSHAFPLGVVLPAEPVRGYSREAPFWRLINTASLERLTPWPTLQPQGPDTMQLDAVRTAIEWAQACGLRIHWGGLASAEPAHQPEWVVGLAGPEALAAVTQHHHAVLQAFPRQIDSIDLLTHPLRPDWITTPQTRQLFGSAAALAPHITRRVRFEQAIDDETSFQAAKLADTMRQEFIDFHGVSLHVRLQAATQDGPLQRALQRYAFLKLPVTISAFEAAGDTGYNTSIAIETALLTLFASPAVEGITFDALTPDTAAVSHASLLNADHEPTSRSDAVDRFFWQRFRTDTTMKTNEIGTLEARVFPGRYRLTTTWPDGSTTTHDLHIPLKPDANAPMIAVIEQ